MIGLILPIAIAIAQAPDVAARPAYPVLAVVRVIDGDTAIVTVRTIEHDPETFQTATFRVRLDGYNASDRDKAPAREALAKLLASGPAWVQPIGKTSAGRTVCRVWIRQADGTLADVADRMRSEGFDVPWGE